MKKASMYDTVDHALAALCGIFLGAASGATVSSLTTDFGAAVGAGAGLVSAAVIGWAAMTCGAPKPSSQIDAPEIVLDKSAYTFLALSVVSAVAIALK